MLVTLSTSRKRTAPPQVVEPVDNAPTSPPVISATAPHPVYGRTPIGRDGFTLDRQLMIMLDYWHKKATEIGGSDSDDAPVARVVAREIYEAAVAYQCSCGRDVAYQLQIIAREMQAEGTVAVLGLNEIAEIAARAMLATNPIEPTKRVAALNRGGKLTRAGMLYRYHAFLIGELETLSWNLYGNRDYAMQMRPVSDTVEKRCRPMKRRGRQYPFFDESKLTSRARAVFKSLKIDAVNADRRV